MYLPIHGTQSVLLRHATIAGYGSPPTCGLHSMGCIEAGMRVSENCNGGQLSLVGSAHSSCSHLQGSLRLSVKDEVARGSSRSGWGYLAGRRESSSARVSQFCEDAGVL